MGAQLQPTPSHYPAGSQHLAQTATTPTTGRHGHNGTNSQRDVYNYGCRVTQVGHTLSLTAVGLVKINMGRVPTTISNDIVDFMCS